MVKYLQKKEASTGNLSPHLISHIGCHENMSKEDVLELNKKI